MLRALPTVAAPICRSTSSPPANRLAPPPVIDRPVPVVWPVIEMDWEMPVKLAVLLVIMAIVPAVEPDEDKDNKVPAVPGSTEVEDKRMSEPVVDMTEVVCGIWKA